MRKSNYLVGNRNHDPPDGRTVPPRALFIRLITVCSPLGFPCYDQPYTSANTSGQFEINSLQVTAIVTYMPHPVTPLYSKQARTTQQIRN